MTLVVTDPQRCPDCGADLAQLAASEPALIRGAGYGATRETVTSYCLTAGCGWVLTVSVSDTRPTGGPR